MGGIEIKINPSVSECESKIVVQQNMNGFSVILSSFGQLNHSLAMITPPNDGLIANTGQFYCYL